MLEAFPAGFVDVQILRVNAPVEVMLSRQVQTCLLVVACLVEFLAGFLRAQAVQVNAPVVLMFSLRIQASFLMVGCLAVFQLSVPACHFPFAVG